MTAKAKVQPASGNVGRVLGREAAAGDTEAEAEPAVMGDCVGVGWGVYGALRTEERRPPGTQCAQETAVPVVNLGSSPPANFLTLNCMASVPAASPAEKGTCLCVSPVQLAAHTASLGGGCVSGCSVSIVLMSTPR